MRRVLYSDLRAAALTLLAVPAPERSALCRQILREADLADRFTRRLGKIHPRWGNGTLAAAVQRRPKAREPSFDDPGFCQCFEVVLHQLQKRPRSAHL